MKLRIIGDLEADLNAALEYDAKSKKMDMQVLIGDCGIFTSQKRFKMHKKFYENYKKDLSINYHTYLSDDPGKFKTETYLIKSEHDDPELFELGTSSPIKKMNIIPVDKKIIRKDGKLIVMLGGTYSKNKSSYPHSSLSGNDRRFFSKHDVYRLISLLSGKQVDALITHQASAGILPNIERAHLKNKYPDEGINTLKTLLDCLNPKYYIHGHHHVNYEDNYKNTKVYGLGNFRKNKKSVLELDL